MKYLHLILTLPGNPEQSLKAAASAAPSLLKLLRRGRPATHEPGLAGTLCQAFGIKRQQDWPLAAICAMADGMNGHGYWLRLDPVHLEAVMGGLLLRSPDSLQLSQAEARDLVADINLHWRREGMEIQAASEVDNPVRWYMHLPEAPNLHTTPLDQMHGEYLTPHLPRGADSRHFLKLINEVQMLMHSHPVNVKRDNAGRLAVNGLWLWGGGTLSDGHHGQRRQTTFDRVAAESFEARALALHANSLCTTPPKKLSDLNASGRALVVLPPPEAGWDGDIETRLAQLEHDWLRPALQQVSRGRIQRLRLDLLGQQAVTLTPLQAWRFWR